MTLKRAYVYSKYFILTRHNIAFFKLSYLFITSMHAIELKLKKTSDTVHLFATPSETGSSPVYTRYSAGLSLNKVSLFFLIMVRKLWFKEQTASKKNWNRADMNVLYLYGLFRFENWGLTRVNRSLNFKGHWRYSLCPAKPTCGYPQFKIYGCGQETGRHTKITQAKLNLLK